MDMKRIIRVTRVFGKGWYTSCQQGVPEHLEEIARFGPVKNMPTRERLRKIQYSEFGGYAVDVEVEE